MKAEEISLVTNGKDVEQKIDVPDGDPGKVSDETKTIPKETQNSSPSDCEQLLLQIFLFFSVVAASLDPLFFYIPTVNDHKKCLEMDETLKKTMLAFRSVMDLTYIFHIAFKIKETRRINWGIIIIDILCVLPIPQVVILVYFARMKGLVSLNWWKFLNFILLFQFALRIYRIYHSFKEFSKDLPADKIARSMLVKGLFNLFLYIMASHFFGATWYLYSVQRESACWQHACKGNSLCSQSTFFCVHRNHSVNDRISGYLSHSCPLTPPSRFDFGMFTPALQSGVVNSMDFPRKFFYCFAWGLRTLSSFGSNLTTSTYLWESLFSAAITVIGLLILLVLIGNLLSYLQFSAKDSENRMRKMKKVEETEKWIRNNGIPSEMGEELKNCVRRQMDKSADVNLENIFNLLQNEKKKSLKQHLCNPIWEKVVEHMKEKQMDVKPYEELIMESLKPVMYDKRIKIIEEGDPLEQMLFCTQGFASVYSTPDKTNLASGNNITVDQLKQGDFFGVELLEAEMARSTSEASSSLCPTSHKTVEIKTKVEGFALEREAIKKIAKVCGTGDGDKKTTGYEKMKIVFGVDLDEWFSSVHKKSA